jgi:hypothetical protein
LNKNDFISFGKKRTKRQLSQELFEEKQMKSQIVISKVTSDNQSERLLNQRIVDTS